MNARKETEKDMKKEEEEEELSGARREVLEGTAACRDHEQKPLTSLPRRCPCDARDVPGRAAACNQAPA